MQYGQVIDRFQSDGSVWLTIWDLKANRKWSIPLSNAADIHAGDLVEYDRGTARGGTIDLRVISSDAIPFDFEPVAPIRQAPERQASATRVATPKELEVVR